MATRVVFANGRELLVAEDEDDVIGAVRREHPNPVSLESAIGGRLHVNWDHVAYVEEAPPQSGEAG
ncbi:MAG: hypothetical protein JSS99_01830 [Actinobacteria bacterium]|nr:hypothetical protein [Actinomycetota bacterium]